VDYVRVIEFAKYDVTNVHPLGILLMVVMTALALMPKRSGATLAILSVCLLMPMEQRVVVGGLDFSLLRLITIVAFIRILVRGEFRGFGFGKLDRILVLWVLSAFCFYVIRTGSGGFVFSLGVAFDALMTWFVIRALVRTPHDVVLLWKQVAWLVLFLSPLILYESMTRHNVFGMFNYDGFDIAVVRNGRVRAMGPLSHPILTGTLGSVVVPVFIGIFRGQKKARVLMGMASVAATVIIVGSGSSGPIMALGVGLLGWGIWRIRGRMRVISWSVVVLLAVIHVVREMPVWHLMLRLSVITGGTGYHRYHLIDAFINNFSEWALAGTDNTAHWGWGLQDTTNQYVAEGVTGGLVTLILFIVLLRTGFAVLRLSRRAFERFEGPKSPGALLAWGCSVSLAAHCVSFVSVTYFGQFLQFFFIFIATIPAFIAVKRPKRARSPAKPASVRAGSRRP
jgi:hypothetical protein